PLRAAAASLVKKHGARFLGKLAKHETTHDGNDEPGYTWNLGFLKSARFAWDHYADEGDEIDLSEVVRTLLRHPSGKFLQELTLGLNRADPDCEYQAILTAIVEEGSKSLRTLFVGDFEYPDQIEISWTNVGNMNDVWKALPNLEKVILQGGEIALGTIHAPKLKHLELRAGGVPAAAVQSIAAAEFPELETLILWTGSDNYGGTSTFSDVAPILEGDRLPKLKHLGIMNSMYTDDVCKALARSKILPQLETLDLSMGTMSDEGRVALVEAKAALKHLKSLNLENNTLESIDGLAGLCAEVKLEDQRGGDYEERYVAVGE
ncbi:MAG: WGR domain-containing protein, partial [Polyangiales bacterium]